MLGINFDMPIAGMTFWDISVAAAYGCFLAALFNAGVKFVLGMMVAIGNAMK